MKLCDIMNRDVLTTTPSTSAEAAWDEMRARNFHHLVVMTDSAVVGVISEHDLGGSRRTTARRMGRAVGELMACDVTSASPSTQIRSAANRMRGRSIGCLPVVEHGKLVGIVTVSDLLERLAAIDNLAG